MQVIYFVIHMFIIWLGYTYRTLAKLYLLSCSPCLASFYFSKCPPPAEMQFALLTIAGSICATSLGILQQNLPGAQAESSWYPSSYGTPFQERIAEADRIAALEASLFWKNTTPSLKKKNNLGQIHHMYSHINLLSEKGLVFYLYLQKFHMDFSLSTVIFATANFDKRKFF